MRIRVPTSDQAPGSKKSQTEGHWTLGFVATGLARDVEKLRLSADVSNCATTAVSRAAKAHVAWLNLSAAMIVITPPQTKEPAHHSVTS